MARSMVGAVITAWSQTASRAESISSAGLSSRMPGHHDDLVVRIGFRQIAAQVAGGRQVVGAVQDDPGLLAHRLEPPRPGNPVQGLADVVLFYGDAFSHQDFGGRQGQAGVACLVGPLQVGGEMFPVVVKPRVMEAAGGQAAAAEIASQSKAGRP